MNNYLPQRLCGGSLIVIGVLCFLESTNLLSWDVWAYVGSLLFVVWGIAIYRFPKAFWLCFPLPRSDREAQN